MSRRTPEYTRTDTRFPYTTLFRSPGPHGRGTALPAIGGELDGGGLHDDLRPRQVRLRPTRPRHFPPGPDARLANMPRLPPRSDAQDNTVPDHLVDDESQPVEAQPAPAPNPGHPTATTPLPASRGPAAPPRPPTGPHIAAPPHTPPHYLATAG